MNALSKVSAIITTHNRLPLLKKAVISVQNQTYPNIELIVVDDGSTDGTKKYCNSIKNAKYIYIPKTKHKNGSYARNLGLSAATGQYIAFLDDDDAWLPDKISQQVQAIRKSPNLGLVYTATITEYNHGAYSRKEHVPTDLSGDCSKKCLTNIIASTSTILFSKQALLEVGGFDENLNYWQDTELLIRICQKYHIASIDAPLTIYRVIPNDQNRRSNNTNGYQETIQYINHKHRKIISKLSKTEKHQRDLFLANDLANRYANGRNKKACKKQLYKIYKLQPTAKNYIKYLMNYTPTVKLRIMSHIHHPLSYSKREGK